MRLSKRLVAAAKRRAFPLSPRSPRGATKIVEVALRFCIGARLDGQTGPQIYARWMWLFRHAYTGCMRPDCWSCESEVAKHQRIILGVLEVVAELERPGP
jgi:hypothetical protein